MKKLKVLYISHSDPGLGGAPKSLVELINNLRSNYNVYPIVCVHSKDMVYNFCKRNNIECYVTGHEDVWTGGIKDPKAWLNWLPQKILLSVHNHEALKYLKEKIDIESIDIIHTNVSVVNFGMYVHKKYNIPHIMHLREDSDVLNNMLYTIRPVNCMNKFVTRFIAISDYVKSGWSKNKIDSNKIDVIYNGLILPSYSKHRIFKDEKIKIIMSGSLISDKGQDLVISAIKSMKSKYRDKIVLDIAGTGNKRYIKRLKKIISENNLKNVRLLGYQKNIANKLSKYDIGIMASKGEAFGRVTVEYMANGLAVLASDTGANKEIIKNKGTGFIFDRNNLKSLIKTLKYMIDNPIETQNVACNGQKEAYSRFTTDINASNIYEEYKKVLKLSK